MTSLAFMLVARAGAALDDVDDELVVQLPRDDALAHGIDDGRLSPASEHAEARCSARAAGLLPRASAHQARDSCEIARREIGKLMSAARRCGCPSRRRRGSPSIPASRSRSGWAPRP